MISRLFLAIAGMTALSAPAFAAAPAPSSVTPALVEAAKKDGSIVFYTDRKSVV